MDYTHGEAGGGGYILHGLRSFDLAAICESGQCFRWERAAEDTYEGVAFGLCRRVSRRGDSLFFHGVQEAEFKSVWHGYFDFGRDYGALAGLLRSDDTLRRAVDYAPGMRILRQDCWEALCSFILSQNNNIARIKGLVRRLCEYFGEPVSGGFAFPGPERLAGLSADNLAPVRSGFRAEYILDAARAVASGRVELEKLPSMPLEEARAALMCIRGVGPKVAECALLYGAGRVECFPVDVWIGRAMKKYFGDGFDITAFGRHAGIVNQYLFYYARGRGEK